MCTSALEVGSSPLARGTLLPTVDEVADAGLIPARAGNTRGLGRGNPPKGAHPRSRGEHISPRRRAHVTVGSSPLARGTLIRNNSKTQLTGLIPARAGNTDQHGTVDR